MPRCHIILSVVVVVASVPAVLPKDPASHPTHRPAAFLSLSSSRTEQHGGPSVRFGPNGCVSTWLNAQSRCMIKTQCTEQDVDNYNFKFICVDDNGEHVRHVFGAGSFDPDETFDTLVSCHACTADSDEIYLTASSKTASVNVEPQQAAATNTAGNANTNALLKELVQEVKELQTQMVTASKDVQKLNEVVFNGNQQMQPPQPVAQSFLRAAPQAPVQKPVQKPGGNVPSQRRPRNDALDHMRMESARKQEERLHAHASYHSTGHRSAGASKSRHQQAVRPATRVARQPHVLTHVKSSHLHENYHRRVEEESSDADASEDGVEEADVTHSQDEEQDADTGNAREQDNSEQSDQRGQAGDQDQDVANDSEGVEDQEDSHDGEGNANDQSDRMQDRVQTQDEDQEQVQEQDDNREEDTAQEQDDAQNQDDGRNQGDARDQDDQSSRGQDEGQVHGQDDDSDQDIAQDQDDAQNQDDARDQGDAREQDGQDRREQDVD